MRNILIMGTPRSGTTLLCSLLNKLPDMVALHEPMNVSDFPENPVSGALADAIEAFCAETRQSLHQRGTATSKHVAGRIPANPASDEIGTSGSRINQEEHGPVQIDKPLSENFALAIKHNAAFTALLKTLSQRFECYAIIRNPLSTLASWNSLEWLPARSGHVPIGEKLDPDLRQLLAAEADLVERQFLVLEWFYKNFQRYLPSKALIRYEDLVASRGRELAKFFPAAVKLGEKLSSKNTNKFYDQALMLNLGQRLLERSGVIWDMYAKPEVESLLAELTSVAIRTAE